jgi:hypothetical protein
LQLQDSPQLQLQQLQHFQHLQLFADLQLRVLQHFWQSAAYIQGLWHRIAIPQLPKLPQQLCVRH